MTDNRQINGNFAVDSSLIRNGEGGASWASPVHFCNRCGHSMIDPRSFIVEYWSSEQSVYFCWCHSCGFRWELTEMKNITAMELEEGEECS
ncbi:hypothetical protein [Domibacillus epiphyticus]|uniref:Uncharacterized protein n=1 Tax=Domibacillus epiphyticus TaxID=1714355 RepID=A0A1V2A4D3_9BACI|nr:hypothetical protein [Domibacillus epiphyticus]OMP65722.1 hypothetical protein BTO28_15765 [Domibacillus epiphyticus]